MAARRWWAYLAPAFLGAGAVLLVGPAPRNLGGALLLAGSGTCPITEPLEIPETRDAVRDELWGAKGYPQMLLRLGWAPDSAAPLPPTPRRALSDVVQWSCQTEQRPCHS